MKIDNISIALIMNLIKMFTPRQIEEIAFKTGFTKRNSGLEAITFFKAFTVELWNVHEITLDIIAGKCEELQYGLSLSKQALYERLKLGAKLMKEMLGLAVNLATKQIYSADVVDVLKQFENVYIADSTTISLPNKLKDLYTGLGGTNADAAVKVQAIFNIIKNQFEKLELFSATVNDNKYTEEIVKLLNPLEVIIFDLGYFCIKSFKKIIQKQAHFISRVKTNTIFYLKSHIEDGKFEKVDILNILRKSTGFVDTRVVIGREKVEVRLVAVRLPEDKINERRRKENKKANAKGKTLTDIELELLAWNIIITSIPPEMLSVETMCEIYRIRWQIELIFKTWKGCFEIDEMNNVGRDYFTCIFCGKLILITLMTALFSGVKKNVFLETERLLSMAKFFKNFREKIAVLIHNLSFRFKNAKKIIQLINDILKRCLDERRKRKTTERMLLEQQLPTTVSLNNGLS